MAKSIKADLFWYLIKKQGLPLDYKLIAADLETTPTMVKNTINIFKRDGMIEVLQSEDYLTIYTSIDRNENLKAVQTPYNKILDLYNNIVHKQAKKAKILSINGRRRVHVKATWTQFPDLSQWEQVFQNVVDSDFLSGRTGRWNNCDFDWIIVTGNFTKILEGKYTKATQTAPDKPTESREEFIKRIYGG